MLYPKNKLIMFISLLLVAGFVATSLASYYVSRSSLRSQISQSELPLTSDNIYSEIQRDLLRPLFISSLMANDTFLRDWVIQGEGSATKITRYLTEIQNKYDAFTCFFVSEKTKNYYHPTGILKKVKEDEIRDDWYYRVRTMKPDYEINVDLDMANKDISHSFINYRVFDYENRFIGATGIGLKVSAVQNLIKKYQDNYDRNIHFIDKWGTIKLNGFAGKHDGMHLSDIEGVSPFVKKILSGEKEYFRYKRDGKTIHLNTRFIPEFNWFLLVEQAEDAATKHILNALIINLAVCAAITLFVLILTNLTITSYQKKIEGIATTDKLTGIINRHAFDVIFSQVLKDVHRKNSSLSVILYDIDLFKSVNDKYGHLAGDAVLKAIVNVTKKYVRNADVLCRWGGEEFLILLKECSREDAFQISEKIRKAISSVPVFYQEHKINTTISSGVTQYKMSEDEDSLLMRVDTLLYRAKEKGRNRSEAG